MISVTWWRESLPPRHEQLMGVSPLFLQSGAKLTEPAIGLTATSFLMWSWRMAGKPSF